jgi:hypothetical protein
VLSVVDTHFWGAVKQSNKGEIIMKLAAAAVSMDATRISKEWEQQINKREMPKDEIPVFGIRFSQALASSTESSISARSMVGSIGKPPASPLPIGDGDQVLTLLTEKVLGIPVQLREPSRSFGQGRSPQTVQGLTLSTVTSYQVEESLLFAAQGSVTATDGRNISFELNLSMTSQTTMTRTMSFDAGLLLDPLVLQFDTTSPLLGESFFTFDLDGDGMAEQLARPGCGCGFLAFDRNGDGEINDGLELFGPSSGSGFAELAQLDNDANLWLDQNDPLFSRLSVWRHGEDGATTLQSLAEAGVGAIALTHAGTTFQLRAGDGRILGQVAASGIFLTEKGEVRALQELDLAVAEDGDTSSTGGGAPMLPERLEAITVLRHIIGMQRLRLRFLVLARQAAREREELVRADRDPLFSWLQEGEAASKDNSPRRTGRGVATTMYSDESFYSQKTQITLPLPRGDERLLS